MIKTTPFRGDMESEDHIDIHDPQPEDLIGRVMNIGPNDDTSMVRIQSAEQTEEGIRIQGTDVLTGAGRSDVIGKYPPSCNFVEGGSVYRVYRCQHQRGDGEWTSVTPWLQNPHSAVSWRGEYEGHENRRLVYKEAEFVGDTEFGLLEERVEITGGTAKISDL